MNLQSYFGLSKPPFPKAVTKDSLLVYPPLKNILQRLHFALERDTIALLVAESGCGKSTALSLFAQSLDAANYNILATSMTTLNPFSLISALGAQLGLPGRRFKGETAISLLTHLRSQPKRTVILIDEAHLLPDQSLQDLRLLTADNLDRHTPFALVLVGQPLLRDRIAEPHHYALAQRIGVRLRLRPLNEDEIHRFLDCHLKAAGYRKKYSLFDKNAVSEIFHHSRGIPRLVQNIALDAMLVAMADQNKSVDADAVSRAIVDMDAM